MNIQLYKCVLVKEFVDRAMTKAPIDLNRRKIPNPKPRYFESTVYVQSEEHLARMITLQERAADQQARRGLFDLAYKIVDYRFDGESVEVEQ